MADEALDSLRQTLNQILKQSHHPDINREIIPIHDDAVVLQLHLKSTPEDSKERIREAATATEEIIRYLFSEDNQLYSGWMKPAAKNLRHLMQAAKDFKSTAFPSSQSVNRKRRRPPVDVSHSVFSSRRTEAASKDVVVGLNDDLYHVKYQIIDVDYHPSKLQFLSIVGAGGIGKTTLARLVYNDELIVTQFKVRAWVTVSQNYDLGSVLSNLVASLEREFSIEKDVGRDIPMESLIRKYLESERFLIVIDDICSKKAWDELKMLFPETYSKSRIMLTTRLYEVASYVDSSSPIHTMNLLNRHDSWILLKSKVFVDGLCPRELEDVGRKIVENCGGLPLSIVVEAGILSKLPKTRDSWKQIASNHGNLETRICLSYNYLPDYARACFLYMGGFPEDYEIRVSELIKLWIGEGFLIFPTGSINLEEEATKVLEDLVERNLVLATRRKFDGKIKSCCLHDIVRDFCIRQAVREKFFLSVMDYLPSPILRKHFLPRLLKNYGRISATWHDLHLKDSMHSSLTHSIICIPVRGYRCVSSIHKFSSLKVFHVLCRKDNLEWKPSQVFDQIHLSYLASNIPTSIVPSTISKLQNLQTLIIYRGKIVLPVEIWMLRQLRHLIAFSFHSIPQPDKETLPLENLQTMSRVMDFVCCGKTLETMRNIKKLGICYSKIGGDYHLYNLRHLSQLEKLKLEGSGCFSLMELEMPKGFLEINGPCPNSFFPPSLKKLTLCGLRLPWKDMTIIGSLPNLQVLKLRNCACIGKYWKTNAGEFGELRFLLIHGSNLKYWNTDGSNFQRLESLILLNCPNLYEIPRKVRDIPTLKFIEVDASNESFQPRHRNIIAFRSV